MTNSFRYNEENWNEYSLVEHLKNVCSNDEKYKNLYAVWTLDQETHSRALSAIYYNFPHYSMHDESHSLSIINKIEMLLGEDRIRSLSPTDTFLILESAYLHDIGMIVAQKELIEEWKKPTFECFLKDLKENSYDIDTVEAATYLLQMQKSENPFKENDWPVKVRHYVTIITSEYYRGKHSIRSANFIKEGANIGLNSNYNKLIPNRLIVLLQKIAISHGANFEDSFNELEHFDNGIGTDTIHPRFISCLLRLGDLLDLDDGRFNEVFENVGYFPETSKIHKEKHRSITLFLVSPEKIQVSAVCKNTEIYRETRAWFDWLKEEVKNLSSRWSDIVPKGFKGGPPSLGNIKLSIEGSENITEQLDLQFNIDQKRAFELIEGQGIYSDKLIFIRELIQNAMDATKIQIWRDIKNGKYEGMSKELLGINEEDLIDIKNKNNFEFPSDLPEKIKKYYPINISIDYDEDKEELSFSIEDRGCGININDLKRMENVGGSWNQDRELMNFIDDMPEFLQPTGNFGIGLHSVFLATDQLKINTKSEDDKGYEITFVSRRKNGYITVKEDRKKKVVGSKISLKIQGEENINDCIRSSDIDIYNAHGLDVFDKEFKNYLKHEKTLLYIEYTKKITKNIEILDIYVNKEKCVLCAVDNRNFSKQITDNTVKSCVIDDYATFKKRSENFLDIEIRDKKEGIILNVYLSIDHTRYYGVRVKFKDIICKESGFMRATPLIYDIHIYKGEAKSILNASRDNLEIKKFTKISMRIEELMNKTMKILGENIKNINSTDEIENIGNSNLAGFLFAYIKCTGEPLKFSNQDIAKNIIMGYFKSIKNNKIVNSQGISYYELTYIDKLICYEEIDNLEVLNDSISKLNDKSIKFAFDLDRWSYSGELSEYIKNNFATHIVILTYNNNNLKGPFEDNCIYSICRKSEHKPIEFLNHIDRENYIQSIILNKSRERFSLIKSTKGNTYNILRVNKNPGIHNSNFINWRFPYAYSNYIISPFYNMPVNYFLEKDVDQIIEFLKRERYFNELIDWVAEYSLEKVNYQGKDIKVDIENAYKEFIQECIDVSKKSKETSEEENSKVYQIEEIALGSVPEEVK